VNSVRGTRGNWKPARNRGFKKSTECVWWRTSTNVRRECVPDWGAAMLKLREAKVVGACVNNVTTNWCLARWAGCGSITCKGEQKPQLC